MAKRPYKPTAVRALEGARSHSLPNPDKALADEPNPAPAVAPGPPDWLNDDALSTWKRLCVVMEPLGLLTEADLEAFAELCVLHSRVVKLHRICNREVDPVVAQKLEYRERLLSDAFRKHAAEFGLTPRGRVGLSVRGHGREKNEMEDLLD